MRASVPTLVFLACAAIVAAGARADEVLRIAGADVGSDGVLTRGEADVVGAEDRPSRTPVLAVETPRIRGRDYQITGRVAYQGVEGEGYLEMWSEFADGSRYFSRTLATSGPMAKLSGSSSPRPFSLPFHLEETTPDPVRLELAVALPGPGRVTLSGLRLESMDAAAGGWWADRTAGLVGGILGGALGVLGSLIGVLASLGRARSFVLGALHVMAALGIASVVAGGAALVLEQPYAVWYPLVLTGAVCASVGLGLRGTVRKRYENGARMATHGTA
jgi:hypothetical protein